MFVWEHTPVCVCLCVLSVWLSRSVMTLLLQQLLPPQFNLAKLAISSVSSSSSSIHTHARTRTNACVLRGLICHQPLSTSSHHHQGDVFVSLCAPHVSAATDKLESSDDWRYAGLWLVDRAPSSRPCPSSPEPSFLRIVVACAKLEPSAATDGCNFNTTTLKLNGFPSLLDFLLFFTACLYSHSPFFVFGRPPPSVGGLMEQLLPKPHCLFTSLRPPPPDGVYDPITAWTHTLR